MRELTPFDSEVVLMCETISERSVCTTRNENDFTIHVCYAEHNNPDYVNAIIDAVRGRYGERFISVKDDPDRNLLEFTIAYAKKELPYTIGNYDTGNANEQFGFVFCHQLEEIRAVRVTRLNTHRLRAFVGNGQMNIERTINGKAWFSFINNGTFVDVPENSYIVKRENANHFEIWPAEKFEAEWERKN